MALKHVAMLGFLGHVWAQQYVRLITTAQVACCALCSLHPFLTCLRSASVGSGVCMHLQSLSGSVQVLACLRPFVHS